MAGKERTELVSIRRSLQDRKGEESSGHVLNTGNWEDCIEALRKAKDDGEVYVKTTGLRKLIGKEESGLGYIISFLDEEGFLDCWNEAGQVQERSYRVSQYSREELEDLGVVYREVLDE
ncbi:MAG: hypothetical protein ABEJ64_02120 [Candidatus Nanohaloarchaea archaeon]